MSENNGNNGVILATVSQSRDEIIKSGGVMLPSRVNRSRVEHNTKYVVCCSGAGDAFLIGKIDSALLVNGHCVIKIDSYATLDRPNTWQEHGNKQGFGYFENPSAIGMYVGKLQFKSVNDIKTAIVYPTKQHSSLDSQFNKLRELRMELVEHKKSLLHKLIDSLNEKQIDEAIDLLAPRT